MFYFIAPEIKLPKHDFLPSPRPFLSLFFFPQPLIMTVSLKITGTNRIAHLWPGCHSSTESRQTITDNLGHEQRASAKPELAPVSSGRGITQGEPSPTGQAPRAPRRTRDQLSAVGGTSRGKPSSHVPSLPATERGVSETPQPGTGRATIFPDPPQAGSGAQPAGGLTLDKQNAQEWEESAATASCCSSWLLHPDSSSDTCTPCVQLPGTTQVVPEVTSSRETPLKWPSGFTSGARLVTRILPGFPDQQFLDSQEGSYCSLLLQIGYGLWGNNFIFLEFCMPRFDPLTVIQKFYLYRGSKLNLHNRFAYEVQGDIGECTGSNK